MIYVYVRSTVEGYATWRDAFDKHSSAREAAGATGEDYIMQNVEDPNDITIILGWSDVESAQAFTQSPDLQEAMKKAGVTGPPEIRFMEIAK